MIIDSLLSELAVLGFGFGYSLSEPSFSNLRAPLEICQRVQVIIDQFITSGESKWESKWVSHVATSWL